MKRTAKAVWRGGGKEGSGVLSTMSGALVELPYTAHARFEAEDGQAGTNPEELIAAAHAGCFAMALAFQISNAGHTPEELAVDSLLTMEKEEIGWTTRTIALTLNARVPGMSNDQFQELAEKARAGCPVSRLLKAEITLDARLA